VTSGGQRRSALPASEREFERKENPRENKIKIDPGRKLMTNNLAAPNWQLLSYRGWPSERRPFFPFHAAYMREPNPYHELGRGYPFPPTFVAIFHTHYRLVLRNLLSLPFGNSIQMSIESIYQGWHAPRASSSAPHPRHFNITIDCSLSYKRCS